MTSVIDHMPSSQPRLRKIRAPAELTSLKPVVSPLNHGSTRWRILMAPQALSADKHRPADIVAQPLIVKYQLANRLRELVTLPLTLKPPCRLPLAFGRSGAYGLDRIGGRTELVRRDVSDGPGLARSVCGMPGSSAQVSGRPHSVAAGCPSLGHRDVAAYPGPGELDRLTRPQILGLSRLKEVKDVLRASRRPEREEMVIRVRERPTAADRHEARVPGPWQDHDRGLAFQDVGLTVRSSLRPAARRDHCALGRPFVRNWLPLFTQCCGQPAGESSNGSWRP